MNTKTFPILVLVLLLASSLTSKAQFKVLFVNDNGVFQPNTDSVLVTFTNTGYEYSIFDARDSLRSPTVTEMGAYDLVIWYCSFDGVGNYFWNGDDSDNPELTAYLETGGMLWVIGTDVLYDRYTTPNNFTSGDFAYDYMGISQYFAQSYGDDGGTGVGQLDLAASGYTSLQTIQWIFPTAWWVDACTPISSATSIYNLGPSGYILAGYSSSIWYSYSGHTVLSFFFDPAIIDTYSNRVILFEEILSHFALFSGIADNLKSNGEVNIYPNPASDRFCLTIPSSITGKSIDLLIADLSGKQIFSKRIENWKNEILLDGSSLPGGMYLISIADGNKSVTKPLMINR